MDTIDHANDAHRDHKAAPLPTIGQPVWYYADHTRTKGMKSHDWDVPFAAVVTYVWSDRLANIVVTDHEGARWPFSRVPLFHGDDKDDGNAPFHCEIDAPKPKEVVTVSGAEDEPIFLNIVTGDVPLASVVLTFTVPVGATYTFTSEKAGIKQIFAAKGSPQTLTLTTAQIAAGALSDLSITVDNDSDVAMIIAVTEQVVNGIIGKTYRFTETVSVSEAPTSRDDAAEQESRRDYDPELGEPYVQNPDSDAKLAPLV